MSGRKIRRKIRKRKPSGRNSGMKLGVFLGIILLSVGLGFLTARYLIGPMIGYDTEGSPVEELKEKIEPEKKAAESSAESKTQSGGYALQFGAFSSREAAQELSSKLEEKGIKTKIVEIDNIFKVMSPTAKEKEETLKDLEEAKEKSVEDVFVTTADAG